MGFTLDVTVFLAACKLAESNCEIVLQLLIKVPNEYGLNEILFYDAGDPISVPIPSLKLGNSGQPDAAENCSSVNADDDKIMWLFYASQGHGDATCR